MSGLYREWVDRVSTLAQAVRDLTPLAASMGLAPATGSDWYGNLCHKLLPQLNQSPQLIVAVTGGTNTGKSVVFNHLAGSQVSRSHANATQTRHPVCAVPQGFAERYDLRGVFPDFEVRRWTHENDPLEEGPDNLLFVREDPAGTQPPRLLLFDTPDVDGTLRQNWRRAALVRHAADVLVCILTQQKYNDAAVREFFQAAATADKTVVVVFNMVQWPRQKELCGGWLARFQKETGVEPVHVYAAPYDPDAAEENRLPFYPLSPGATAPRQDLADLQFDAIKIRSFRGSLREVLDPHDGLPAWLGQMAARAAQFRTARDLLAHDLQVRITDLPQLPRRLVWDEIWVWLESRRTRFDRAVNGMYSAMGSLLTRWFRKDPEAELAEFQEKEDDRLRLALAEFLDRIDVLRRGGNAMVRQALERTPGPAERRALFDELHVRRERMPLLTEGYRQFVRAELDQFERDNPGLVRFITWTLVSTAVVRPVVTVALFSVGAHAVELTAGHIVNAAGDIAVGAATAVSGEGLFAGAKLPLQRLLNLLFSRFYAERAEILAATLHELVLGQAVRDIGQFATADGSDAFHRANQAIAALAPEIPVLGETATTGSR